MRQADRNTVRQTYRQEKQADRKAVRQTDILKGRQADREVESWHQTLLA